MKAICINADNLYGIKPTFKEGDILEVEQHPLFFWDYKVTGYGVIGWDKNRFILLSDRDERDYIKIKTRTIGV